MDWPSQQRRYAKITRCVLILVVMDWPSQNPLLSRRRRNCVLILVVMDWPSQFMRQVMMKNKNVLILVVMDWLSQRWGSASRKRRVLILVVMDWLSQSGKKVFITSLGLNPCCNGLAFAVPQRALRARFKS